MKEKRISYEGFKIKCDKCPGTLLPMISTTKMVTIGGKPVVNITDKTIGANIPMFPSCTATPTKICNPKFTKWIDTAEPTVNIEKAIPLVEHSELICTAGGGFVGFEPPVAKSEIMGPKKPNMVDKAKGKINGVANKAKSVATNATNKINSQISGVLDGAKPIGKIFDNKALKSTINGASAALNQANLSKKQIDIQLESLENQIPQLKNKISSTINDIEVPQINDLGIEKNDAITDKEEQFFQNEIQNSINELENYYNQEINTSSLVNLDGTPSNRIPTFDDRTPLERWSDNKKEHEKLLDQLAEHEYNRMTEEVTAYNKDAIFEEDESSKKAIASLYGLYVSSGQSSIPPNPQKGEITKILKEKAQKKAQKKLDKKTARSKNKLNKKIQDELDEELEKLGYNKAQKKINAAQAKSAEVQKDMDKASKWLGRMDNFDGFIDNLKEKYTGKVSAKLNKSITSINQNMALANTSMDGMSFAVDGFPKGDVVTNVKAKQEKKKEEEEEKTTPPPVVTPPEETKPPEETEEETNECSFTKITVVKNNKTHEVLYGKDEKDYGNTNKHHNRSLPEPIQFVAGTREKYKKNLELIIENLKLPPNEFDDAIFYSIDNDTKTTPLKSGSIVKIPFDINYQFEGDHDKILYSFMGLTEPRKTIYNIPLELCSYSTNIDVEVLPDAEWVLLFSFGSKDPLVYTHGNQPPGDIFKKHQDKAIRVGRANSSKKGMGKGKRSAEVKVLYGANYNNGKTIINKGASVILDKAYTPLKRISRLTELLDKTADYLRGDHVDGSDKAVSIAIIPTAISIAGYHKYIDSDAFYSKNKEVKFEINVDPLLGANIEVDLVRTGQKRVPIIIFLNKVIDKLTSKEISEVFYFTIGVSFNIKLKASLSANSGEAELIGKTTATAALTIKMGFHIEGSFLGFEYEALMEGKLAGNFDFFIEAGYRKKWFFNPEVDFSGIKASILIRGSVSGWFIEEQIEAKYQGVIGKWDSPFATGELTIIDGKS
ncbi:hypothetical protein GCM10009430_17870 [Aquimarina litoralis]|uniref:DUF4280 domain-containing protein n=1 Tax=Aquimarina litoralis TaxID=584605 RepID=A0ABN1IQ55_9FLAO